MAGDFLGTDFLETDFDTVGDQLPLVSLDLIDNVLSTTADADITLNADSGNPIIMYGVCWNTTGAPTVGDSNVHVGSLTGSGALLSATSLVNGVGDLNIGNYYNAVTQGGIDNTGATSVTSAIGTAISAYKAGGYDGLYFPTGTYLLSTTLIVPTGTTLVGQSMTGAWLRGTVRVDDNSSFTDLKIGPNATATYGAVYTNSGADTVTFTRCHFRGGGNQYHGGVVLVGPAAASNITFTDCEFERALSSENNVSVYAADGNLSYITFDGCTFGVTNGSASGCARMHCECYTWPNQANYLWHHLTFTGCEFLAHSSWGLDLACGPMSVSYTALVEDCLFHGSQSGSAIDIECPSDVTITGNTFYRYGGFAVLIAETEIISNDTQYVITDNLFDYDTIEGGITVYWPVIDLCTSNNTVTGNTFTHHGGPFDAGYGEMPAVYVHNTTATPNSGCVYGVAEGNVVTGNTFNLDADTVAVAESGGATDNTITPNTINRT